MLRYKYFSFLFLMFSISGIVHAQNKPYYIKGIVVDKNSHKPIENTTVSIKGISPTSTDFSGIYFLSCFEKKSDISFSRVGYKQLVISLTELLKSDTLRLNIELEPVNTTLEAVEISSNPTVIAGFKNLDIEDYQLIGSHMIVLGERQKEKFQLFLLDENYKTLRKYSLSAEGKIPVLQKDYNGNINIITDNNIYRVLFEKDSLRFEIIPQTIFHESIEPCITKRDSFLYYSDQIWDIPYFSYYIYNVNTKTRTPINKITNKSLLALYNIQYTELSNACQDIYGNNWYPFCKKGANDISLQTNTPLNIVSARLTGFTHTLYYKFLYAPLFFVNDTICIFDHYNNSLYKYTMKGQLKDSCIIDYHLKKEWTPHLLQDNTTQNIYAINYKDGWHKIFKINTHNGEINKDPIVPYYKYIENLKIENGYLYYIYRPFESSQAKYLYREPLPY